MASYTRYRDLSVQGTGTNGSYAVGKKGSEVAVITSAGTVITVTANTIVAAIATANTFIGETVSLVTSFTTASSAQSAYVIVPIAGNVAAVYVTPDTAARAAAYTVVHGSAGANIASGTNTTSVAGVVTALTLSAGSVAVTAGESLLISRGVQGTTAGSYVTVQITRTA